jgi:hypothetical protein
MPIFLNSNGNVVGPYEEAELREMLEYGETRTDIPAWKEGAADWSTLGQLLNPDGETKPFSQGSPSSPRQAKTSTSTGETLGAYGAYGKQLSASEKSHRPAKLVPKSPSLNGQTEMVHGALWCLGGIIATTIGYHMASAGLNNGRYLVFTGAILYGATVFLRGFFSR